VANHIQLKAWRIWHPTWLGDAAAGACMEVNGDAQGLQLQAALVPAAVWAPRSSWPC